MIGLDVESAMRGVNQSVYVRYPFTTTSTEFTELKLTMQYDDGFVAYFNGHEIARGNAPSNLSWNSGAVGDRIDSVAIVPVVIDISSASQWLVPGDNVLAIHGLNVVIGSSDMLLTVALDGTIVEETVLPKERYFSTPSPGESNSESSLAASPIFLALRQNLWVKA